MAESTVRSWIIESQKGDYSGLVCKTFPSPRQISDDEVLVEMRAASLNYRDLVAAKGELGLVSMENVISGSDGAGVVLQAGKKADSFKPGDKVVTHMLPLTYDDESLDDLDDYTFPSAGYLTAGLGLTTHGTLTTHGVFHKSCIVKFTGKLTFEEAATLPVSGLTAWNGLMGLPGKQVKRGDWVLVQGSGGLSVAAMQIALAVGATIVATTSSEEKGQRLRELGAAHVINYRDKPDWGVTARSLTPSNRGFDFVMDVAGNESLGPSIKALRTDGLLVVAGLIGGGGDPVPLMALLSSNSTARGIFLATRQMMRDFVAFAEDNGLKPAMDEEIFPLDRVKEAFEKLAAQKHFSKVVISIP